MEKEIHHANSDEHTTEYGALHHEHPEYREHDSEKQYSSQGTSLDELLDIPTLRDIEAIFFSHIARIHGDNIAIGRSRTRESLTHRMFAEPIDTCDHAFEMSLG